MNSFRSERRFCFTQNQKRSVTEVVSTVQAQSCMGACKAKGLVCERSLFAEINKCEVLQKHFSCKTCSTNVGYDQPAYVVLTAQVDSQPGSCLVNGNAEYYSCAGTHKDTQRICPCVIA
jgi:hypothetical protein